MFHKATKTKSNLRLALYGPSGSGKTMTALRVGLALGRPLALIDTERGSASKYAGESVDGECLDFDVLELEKFTPQAYIAAIGAAAEAGYATLVIDSLSHAWESILESKDAMGGKFTDWAKLTPLQNRLIDCIVSYPGDVIVTMRSKVHYDVAKDDRGKAVPTKFALAPVQRSGVEYEFDVVGIMDQENTLYVDKSRCPALMVERHHRKPGKDFARELRSWLDRGDEGPSKSYVLFSNHLAAGDLSKAAHEAAHGNMSVAEKALARTAYRKAQDEAKAPAAVKATAATSAKAKLMGSASVSGSVVDVQADRDGAIGFCYQEDQGEA